jgi:hypothetical protein
MPLQQLTRVEGSSNCQLHGHAGTKVWLGKLSDSVTGRTGTTDSVVAFAQVVGNLNLGSAFLACGTTKFLDLITIQSNDRDHASVDCVRGRLHGFTTSLAVIVSKINKKVRIKWLIQETKFEENTLLT